jgi:hypothetical protein
MLQFFVFRDYINEMHGSRCRIPGKKISSGSVAQRYLIPTQKAIHSLHIGQQPSIQKGM